jgi:hypothetical protein
MPCPAEGVMYEILDDEKNIIAACRLGWSFAETRLGRLRMLGLSTQPTRYCLYRFTSQHVGWVGALAETRHWRLKSSSMRKAKKSPN